jgi:hypothetical protein
MSLSIKNATCNYPQNGQPTCNNDGQLVFVYDACSNLEQIRVFLNADNTQLPVSIFPAGNKKSFRVQKNNLQPGAYSIRIEVDKNGDSTYDYIKSETFVIECDCVYCNNTTTAFSNSGCGCCDLQGAYLEYEDSLDTLTVTSLGPTCNAGYIYEVFIMGTPIDDRVKVFRGLPSSPLQVYVLPALLGNALQNGATYNIDVIIRCGNCLVWYLATVEVNGNNRIFSYSFKFSTK